MSDNYLESVKKQFAYYRMLAEKAIAQISDADLYRKYNDESNSIAVIMNHMAGNMLSRFSDFLTTDGEKPWRDRDAEFADQAENITALLDRWKEGWTTLMNTLEKLTDEDLQKEVFIRNQGHTVIEAINRQLAHYPYHAGQIVFIARMIAGSSWQTLSIPKGDSGKYNDDKFSAERHREHFTDEYLKDGK